MIRVKKLSPNARLPERKYDSAGYDLYAAEGIDIHPGEVTPIKLGIALEFPKWMVGLLYDRSGMGKRGFKVMGGVMDADYRGEWMVMLLNTGTHIREVKVGDRIAQVLFHRVEHPVLQEASYLTDSSRGDGRWGSTGN